jgi:hypothetical protein
MYEGRSSIRTAVIVKYSYAGDLNLDGADRRGDYGIIDNYYQFAGTSGYSNGDFNFDGVIDAGDYGLIDNAYQMQGRRSNIVFMVVLNDIDILDGHVHCFASDLWPHTWSACVTPARGSFALLDTGNDGHDPDRQQLRKRVAREARDAG